MAHMTPKEVIEMDDWYFNSWVDRLGRVEYITDQMDFSGGNIHKDFFVSLLAHPAV